MFSHEIFARGSQGFLLILELFVFVKVLWQRMPHIEQNLKTAHWRFGKRKETQVLLS